ncbi:MAG: hypothetical protein M3450_06380 [Actinomycetota bacterium]|nr:hypothetical protein [Actinomycetota bacterium]
MTTTRRCLAVGLLWLGVITWAASPASAQVDVRYAGPGLAVPTINAPGPAGGALAAGPAGGVLAASGQRAVVTVNESVPSQVLASQVGGGVAGTAQAPVDLAFTGADVLMLMTIGLSLTALGMIARRARPRVLPEA